MSASIKWTLLESFARSTNAADYTAAGWSFSIAPGGSAGVGYGGDDAVLGKTACVVNSNFSNWVLYQKSLGWDGAAPHSPTVGMRFYIPSGVSNSIQVILLDYNGSTMGSVSLSAPSGILTISDSTGVKYTSPQPVINMGVPYYLEVNLTPSKTSGAMTAWLNDNVVGSTISGLNTDPNSIGSVQFAQFRSNGGEFVFTDVGVLDASVSGNPTSYGDNDVQILVPVSNGATVQFTPNGLAANWQNVANIPPNASDFNSSTTVGAVDQVKVGNLSALTESVGGIFIVTSAENVSGGTHTYSQQYAGSSGSTFGSSGAFTLTNGYLTYGSSPTVDPNTSAAWTIAGINGMTLGYTLDS